MIGCDDPECKYEWVSGFVPSRRIGSINLLQFHLECVGLKAVPEDDEWYCRECAQRQVKNRRR